MTVVWTEVRWAGRWYVVSDEAITYTNGTTRVHLPNRDGRGQYPVFNKTTIEQVLAKKAADEAAAAQAAADAAEKAAAGAKTEKSDLKSKLKRWLKKKIRDDIVRAVPIGTEKRWSIPFTKKAVFDELDLGGKSPSATFKQGAQSKQLRL